MPRRVRERGRETSASRALVITVLFGLIFFALLEFLLQRGHAASNAGEAAVAAALWGLVMWHFAWKSGKVSGK